MTMSRFGGLVDYIPDVCEPDAGCVTRSVPPLPHVRFAFTVRSTCTVCGAADVENFNYERAL